MVTKVHEVADLCKRIEDKGLALKIDFGVPQIYTMHNAKIEKASQLDAFKNCFDDRIVRKMVLEFDIGNDDLQSIVIDLQNVVGVSIM